MKMKIIFVFLMLILSKISLAECVLKNPGDDPFPFPFSRHIILENYNSWIQLESHKNFEVQIHFIKIHDEDFIKYKIRSSIDGTIDTYGIAKAKNNLYCDVSYRRNICFATISNKVVIIPNYQLQCN